MRCYQYYIITSLIIVQLLTTVTLSCFSQLPRLSSYTSAAATIYLDFDGHTVDGTTWNWNGPIHAAPTIISNEAIEEIFKRVAEDFRIFNLNITTDSTVFANAPFSKRERVIITPTSNWYTKPAGGAALVNSFLWGDDTPVWVFSDFLFNDPKYISEAISHEVGHSLGLHHQSKYNDKCNLTKEYAEGIGDKEIGWAPIMGENYYKNTTTWHTGTSVIGCDFIQNDIEVIVRNGVGLRNDDHGNDIHSATFIKNKNEQFEINGLINDENDKDFFRFDIKQTSNIKIEATPYNVGTGNQGANVDLELKLFNSNGDSIGVYNPALSLSASIDTHLVSDVYYLSVDGVGNENLSDYGSVGYYNIKVSVEATLPIITLKLKGEIRRNEHIIKWVYASEESFKESIIEYSLDGQKFSPLQTISSPITDFSYQPLLSGSIFYRIKMVNVKNNEEYYSNIISLKSIQSENIVLLTNRIRSSIQLNINEGNYSYQLIDLNGRLLQRGILTEGLNNIPVNTGITGILFLKVFNQNDQLVFRLIKQ